MEDLIIMAYVLYGREYIGIMKLMTAFQTLGVNDKDD